MRNAECRMRNDLNLRNFKDYKSEGMRNAEGRLRNSLNLRSFSYKAPDMLEFNVNTSEIDIPHSEININRKSKIVTRKSFGYSQYPSSYPRKRNGGDA